MPHPTQPPVTPAPLPVLTLAVPHGHHLTATASAEPDYPGIYVMVDDVVAAVVEWHSTYQTVVIRGYSAETVDNPEGDPVHYHRWDTGADLPR